MNPQLERVIPLNQYAPENYDSSQLALMLGNTGRRLKAQLPHLGLSLEKVAILLDAESAAEAGIDVELLRQLNPGLIYRTKEDYRFAISSLRSLITEFEDQIGSPESIREWITAAEEDFISRFPEESEN